ncbi:DUF1269 domain-containing protein [Craurococcus roseus]|uniref:DUF1269 domain-containing protein n=1 Tax=Craurococcus roseus TaxID=77585 RepID=A0ABN1EUJ0_9PROT
MSELIVVGFEDTEQADRALNELVRLTKEHLIDLEDAVVAIRSPDGTVRIKQSVNLVGLGAAQGGLSGALWGSLVGLLFLNPLLGFAAGAAVGAGSGALAGSLGDYGIDDDLIRSIGETLQPNTSALFVLVRKVQPEKVLADITGAGFKGRVIRSSLSPDQEQRLQAALSQARRQDMGAAPASGAASAAAPSSQPFGGAAGATATAGPDPV